jgi:hypothetical protein
MNYKNQIKKTKIIELGELKNPSTNQNKGNET